MKGIPNTKNVTKQDDGYYLRKYVNGRHIYLGYATTLISALMKLDWCKAHNWEKYPQEYSYIIKNGDSYSIRKWNGTKLEYCGTFKTLKEAQKEVELLKKYDWDMETVCNLDERPDGKTIYLGREMYD